MRRFTSKGVAVEMWHEAFGVYGPIVAARSFPPIDLKGTPTLQLAIDNDAVTDVRRWTTVINFCPFCGKKIGE